jgi:hypothetical protein
VIIITQRILAHAHLHECIIYLICFLSVQNRASRETQNRILLQRPFLVDHVNCRLNWFHLNPISQWVRNISLISFHVRCFVSKRMFARIFFHVQDQKMKVETGQEDFGLVRGIIRHARYPLCCLSPAGVMYSHRIVLLVLTIA